MINDTLHIALHFYCHEVLLYTIGFDAFFREIFSGLYFISSMDKLNSSESIHPRASRGLKGSLEHSKCIVISQSYKMWNHDFSRFIMSYITHILVETQKGIGTSWKQSHPAIPKMSNSARCYWDGRIKLNECQSPPVAIQKGRLLGCLDSSLLGDGGIKYEGLEAGKNSFGERLWGFPQPREAKEKSQISKHQKVYYRSNWKHLRLKTFCLHSRIN